MEKKNIRHTPLLGLIQDVRQVILSARKFVARNIDTVQVLTNYEIGRRIVENEQKGSTRAEYGKETLKALAEELTAEFGRGFSEDNLSNMRKFYVVYRSQKQISETVSRKFLKQKSETASRKSDVVKYEAVSRILSCSHYRELLKEDNLVGSCLSPNVKKLKKENHGDVSI